MSDLYDMAQDSFFELSDYFSSIIETLRCHPKDNLPSAKIETEEVGDKLIEEELIANCVPLMFAGRETTTKLIGKGMLALLRNPQQKQILQGDGDLIGSAVEDLLCFDSPAPKAARTAVVDLDIGGKTIEAGELSMLCYGAANRGLEQLKNPDRLDLIRKDNRHLGFSQGLHYCLGSASARMESQVAIKTLLERMPNIKLAGGNPERNSNIHL